MSGLGPAAIIKAGIDVVGAVVSGIANSASMKNELASQKEIVERKQSELETNYKQSKLELDTQYKQSDSALKYNIGYTSSLRGQSAGFASQSNVKSTQFMYEDLAMMLDELSSQQGQVVHSAAQTGFRNTGTQEQALAEVEEAKQYQIDRAVESIKMNSAESFAVASENYFSATAQIEQYQTNLVNLRTNYEQAKVSLENQYKQNSAELQDALDQIARDEEDAEYKWWEVTLDVLTLGIAGYGDVKAAYAKDEINALQSELMELQIEQYTKNTSKKSSYSKAKANTQMVK